MPVQLEGHAATKPRSVRALSFMVGMLVTLAVLIAGNAMLSGAPAGPIAAPNEVAGSAR